MRIVIDYTPAVHQGAGIGRHTRGLVSALAPQARQHDITLLVLGRPAGDAAVEVPAGCHLRVVPLPNRWLTVGWHRLRLPLPVTWLSGPADLFHASDFVLPPTGGARTLLTVHDLSFLTVPECAEAGLRTYLTGVVPRSVARADHILADSRSTQQDLCELLGVPVDKVTVVYPGVEIRFRPIDDEEKLIAVRERYGLGDRPFVLGLGTLEPRKNWDGLIRAWARMRRATGLPHRLVIGGGRGWLVAGIFQAVEEAGDLRADIVFPGFVEDADLPALYAAADIFAFPSHYEGFGIPIVEAMACGTPVVCGDNSSQGEAAGNAALQVNARDDSALAHALQRLIEDSALRAQCRRRGLAQAQHFTWEAAATTLLSAYERVGGHG